jgi:hypothetical protein
MTNLERFEEIEIEDLKIQRLNSISSNTDNLKDDLKALIEINRGTLKELESLQIKMRQLGYTLSILIIISIAYSA